MSDRSLVGAKLTLLLQGTIQNTLTDGTVVSVAVPAISIKQSLPNGIADQQGNRAWQISGTLTVGDIANIDLKSLTGVDIGAGAGNDALGQAADFLTIETVTILNTNDVGSPGDLEVTPGTKHGWAPIGSHTVATGGSIKGGGVILKHDPSTGKFLLTSTSRMLRLYAPNGTVAYTVAVIARNDLDESSSSSSSLSSQSSQSTSSQSTSSSSSSSKSTSSSSSSSSSQSSSSGVP